MLCCIWLECHHGEMIEHTSECNASLGMFLRQVVALANKARCWDGRIQPLQGDRYPARTSQNHKGRWPMVFPRHN